MRFKHMGWLRLSLAETETEKTPGTRAETYCVRHIIGKLLSSLKSLTHVSFQRELIAGW